ncbi:hypothetical protein [Bradyrhizobium cytisi]|uniref:Uncharacterized protein n=1 Tax=Bradyrhizobium cytisi TaxID=515489 RepID=A0A5S4WKE0_9BRAD|nr:hypothetical protein [Bradyrhizobium cytisi]TYL80827.1 hypothetical protein FXB38_24300 [Bradyrhizobium cytisi]
MDTSIANRLAKPLRLRATFLYLGWIISGEASSSAKPTRFSAPGGDRFTNVGDGCPNTAQFIVGG